jgi:hypothetical protein
VPCRNFEGHGLSSIFCDRLLPLAVHVELQVDAGTSEGLAPSVDGLNGEALTPLAFVHAHNELLAAGFGDDVLIAAYDAALLDDRGAVFALY